MRKRAKILVLLLAAAIITCFAGVSTYSSPHQPYGEHIGELKFLKVKVVYTNPYFFTSDGLPGYYIGLPMSYELHLTNTGPRTFKLLTVSAIHEYYESGICNRWWYPYPEVVEYEKGEPLPGDSSEVWEAVEIGPYETVILSDSYIPPEETCSGLDQTHVIIIHTNEQGEPVALIYDEPEAGVFCPPPPGMDAFSGSSGSSLSKDWAKCGCVGWEAIILFLIIILIKRRKRIYLPVD